MITPFVAYLMKFLEKFCNDKIILDSNFSGCLYGCVCVMPTLEPQPKSQKLKPLPDVKNPNCDKEYCQLGCICASLAANKKPTKDHCGSPMCLNDCRCNKRDPISLRSRAAESRWVT